MHQQLLHTKGGSSSGNASHTKLLSFWSLRAGVVKLLRPRSLACSRRLLPSWAAPLAQPRACGAHSTFGRLGSRAAQARTAGVEHYLWLGASFCGLSFSLARTKGSTAPPFRPFRSSSSSSMTARSGGRAGGAATAAAAATPEKTAGGEEQGAGQGQGQGQALPEPLAKAETQLRACALASLKACIAVPQDKAWVVS